MNSTNNVVSILDYMHLPIKYTPQGEYGQVINLISYLAYKVQPTNRTQHHSCIIKRMISSG